uniref:U6 snRNA-associated Sm-like protein LSm7 n=1 Tax=Griffithsia japonica TaxID=83288 RepID=Q7XY62_GRIJA|nr:U6 snRNA-associated Sm-like protein LSm7 [Griffithsia japonica]|eukprot:GO256031.1.p1 GENE.GO256031.1~~GO256031.1.p1  ORF type:complete len:111 (+),score=18.39 GO256031.1:53-385(+)
MSHSHDRGAPKKGASQKVILDLSKYSDKDVIVRLAGGRQVRGVLKGWDPLLNLVLDEVVEQLRDVDDSYRLSGKERKLGLVVVRGTSVMTVSPVDGVEQIENPFGQEQKD